ncbi:MAG: hypothetical protein IPG86_13640 [Chitinophagaceae bacterium]|nr:hypothetical protein [Chitinophagaceae bacterium]
MKFIFTLISFSFFGTLQAQFEAIVSRIRDSREPQYTIQPVYCGFSFCRGIRVANYLPPVDIPTVRRSLEGLQLPIRVSLHPRPLDTVKQNPLLVNQLKPCRVSLRCGATQIPAEPILLVDGNLVDSFSYLQKIPISEIDQIDSLKGPAATAIFGSHAVRGAIFVTTQKSKIRTLYIRDFQDRQPIPRTTISFISADRKDTLVFFASDSGILVTGRLKRDMNYQVSISASGYRPISFSYKNKFSQANPDEWLLQRNMITNQEVVIVNYIHWKTKKISCCVLGITRCEKHQLLTASSKKETKAFPNPARPGQTVTIEQHLESDEKVSLQIFNVAGIQKGSWNMPATKGLNQLRFTTGQHWAAGTYFFRILYANGRVAASGSIIIQ